MCVRECVCAWCVCVCVCALFEYVFEVSHEARRDVEVNKDCEPEQIERV